MAMEIGKLTVHSRDKVGKGISRQLRRQGLVPGVCYGSGLDEALQITLDPKLLKASLDPEKRRNTVIDITIKSEGGDKTVKAMLWDYQIHPIKRFVTHVDLKSIDPEKVVSTEVPVVLVGRAVGLVNGGQLNVARHEITIEAKPADIPARFELDVTELDLGDVRHVSDLSIPAGVELVTPPKLTLVTCLAPKAVVEEVTPVEGEEGAEGEAPAEGEAKDGAAPAAKKEGDS